MVLPVLYGPPHAGRGRAADQALEADQAPRSATRTALRKGVSSLVGHVSAKRCCIGHMTAAKSKTHQSAILTSQFPTPRLVLLPRPPQFMCRSSANRLVVLWAAPKIRLWR